MAKCSLLLYQGVPGVCVRCGRKLTGRQRKWCGPDCERAWQRNHIWPMAREAAKRRDGNRCVKCGGDGSPYIQIIDRHYGKVLGIEIPDGEKVYKIWRGVPWLEVNHIEPRRGKGYNSGCHNHLSNLEVLCHTCHVIETGLQRQRATVEA